MHVTTDMIVGTGLVIALLAAILFGGSAELQTTLGSGLIGEWDKYRGCKMEHAACEAYGIKILCFSK